VCVCCSVCVLCKCCSVSACVYAVRYVAQRYVLQCVLPFVLQCECKSLHCAVCWTEVRVAVCLCVLQCSCGKRATYYRSRNNPRIQPQVIPSASLKSHTHTHTHTNTHTHTRTRARTHTKGVRNNPRIQLERTLSLVRSLKHTRTHTHTQLILLVANLPAAATRPATRTAKHIHTLTLSRIQLERTLM